MSHSSHHRSRVVRWLAVAAMLAFGSAWVRADEAAQDVAIERAFLQEDFARVAELAPAFITQQPTHPRLPRVWLWLALSLERLQRSPDALDELARLKSQLPPDHPLLPELLFWDGEASRRSFQMVRAKQAYERLLEESPDAIWASRARLGLGLVYLHQQTFRRALELFQLVAAAEAGTPIALDARLFEGLCRLRLEQYAEAAGVFQALLAALKEPADRPPQGHDELIAQVAFYLGESLSGLGRFAEAIQAYELAVGAAAVGLWGERSQFGLGWATYQEGRCGESLAAFDRYLHQMKADHRSEALFAQGDCLMRAGREPEALSRFEQIVSRDPGHPLAVESGLLIIEAYQRAERLTLATELVHTLLRWPLDEAARAKLQLKLGSITLRSGNATKAQTIFTLAAQRPEPPIRQAALTGLGDVQMFLGDLALARRYYEDAIDLPADRSQTDYATYQVGRIHLQTGRLAEAAEIFQRLTDGADGALKTDARFALILAYLNQDLEASARAALAAIRLQAPDGETAARAAYYQALLALSEGDETAAWQLCQEAIAEAPRTDEALEARLLLADLRTQWVGAAEVVEQLRQAYELADLPRRHRAKLAMRLGDVARKADDYAGAIRWYDEAVRLWSSLRGEAEYHAASCYELGGDFDVAMRWYQAIRLPPWRVRGQLAAAKLLERANRPAEAEAIYAALAEEPIPEANAVRERLATLRGTELSDEVRP